MERVTNLLLGCWLIVSSFGVLAQYHLPTLPLTLSLTDLILVVMLGLNATHLLITHAKFRFPPGFGLGVLFFGLSLISLAFTAFGLPFLDLLVSGGYYLRLVLYFGLYCVVYNLSVKPNMALLILPVVGFALLGLIQYWLVPDLRFLEPLGWDLHYYRLTSTFLDPNFAGMFLVLGLLFLLARGTFPSWHLAAYLSMFSALMLTYSRSSYLAYLIGLVIWLSQTRRWKSFGLLVLVFIFSFFLLPHSQGGEGQNLTRTSTIYARVANYSQAWQLFVERPVLGFGYNTLGFVKQSHGLVPVNQMANHANFGFDSSLLTILTTTGLLGLGAYLAWLVKLSAGSLGRLLTLPLLVHALFVNSLLFPWIFGWWLVSLASE